VENVENHLMKLTMRANTPLSSGYHPEEDTSELLVDAFHWEIFRYILNFLMDQQ
jgi:hypothetical protein